MSSSSSSTSPRGTTQLEVIGTPRASSRVVTSSSSASKTRYTGPSLRSPATGDSVNESAAEMRERATGRRVPRSASLGEPVDQALVDRGRQQVADVTAVGSNLFDH